METNFRAKVTWNELEALSKYLTKSECQYMIEIGTKHAGTVGLLAEKFLDVTFITVDIRRNSGGDIDIEETENIIFIIGESANVGEKAADILKPKVGLIFIDGHHEINQIRNDLEAWEFTLNKNGFIALHDAIKCNETPEVGESRTPAIDGTHQIRQQEGPKQALIEFQKNGWVLVKAVHSTAFLQREKNEGLSGSNQST